MREEIFPMVLGALMACLIGGCIYLANNMPVPKVQLAVQER